MTDRVQLGWRVPDPIWDILVEHTVDKWGEQDPYIRYELESVMVEFIDGDEELAEAEALLRKALHYTGLSSSTATVSSSVDHSNTKKLGHRVSEWVKQEFAAMAKEDYSDSLGGVLARAIEAYVDGGRSQRILNNTKQLVNGIISGSTDESNENLDLPADGGGSTQAAIENQSGGDERPASENGTDSDSTSDGDETVDVDPNLVMEIANKLPDGGFPEVDLHEEICKTVNGNQATIAAYSEGVCDYLNMLKHPHKDHMYITEEQRKTATFWCDLNRELRLTRLRRLLVYEALEMDSRKYGVEYTDVQQLFKEVYLEGPSHDYAYTLMEEAASIDGFSYKKRHGTYQLRVDIKQVKSGILQDVFDEWGDQIDNDGLTVNAALSSYTSHSQPDQEAGADD